MDATRISITICGDGGCGKSSITLRLVRSVWTNAYDPTIEDSYSITRQIDGKTYHLSLTDTAGQEEYRGMWASSNATSDAFLLVYDITSTSSLAALEDFNDLIEIESETRLERQLQEQETLRSSAAAASSTTSTSQRNKNLCKRNRADPHGASTRNASNKRTPDLQTLTTVPIKIVAGNKCDLAESRTVPSKVGLEWARRHGCGFMETSARNTVNIEETFALIVRRVVEARRVAALDAGLLLDADADVHAGVGERDGAARGAAADCISPPAGKRALPPGGLSFDGRGFGLGTRLATTAPLSPLPVAEEKAFEADGGWRPWWRRMLCLR